jgi:hypothetical protein
LERARLKARVACRSRVKAKACRARCRTSRANAYVECSERIRLDVKRSVTGLLMDRSLLRAARTDDCARARDCLDAYNVDVHWRDENRAAIRIAIDGSNGRVEFRFGRHRSIHRSRGRRYGPSWRKRGEAEWRSGSRGRRALFLWLLWALGCEAAPKHEAVEKRE